MMRRARPLRRRNSSVGLINGHVQSFCVLLVQLWQLFGAKVFVLSHLVAGITSQIVASDAVVVLVPIGEQGAEAFCG